MNGLHGYSTRFIDDRHVVPSHHVDYFRRAYGVSDAIHPTLAPAIVDQMQSLEDVTDRPPVVGTIGRQAGQVRLRLKQDTKQRTVRDHVEQFTGVGTHIYTDEYDSYNTIERTRSMVCHSRGGMGTR